MAMSKRILLLLVLVIVCLATVAIYFFEETRQLTGVVRDADSGAPLAGAQVSAADFTATSDAEGVYNLSIPRGEYALSAQIDGYASLQTNLNGDDLFARAFAVDFVMQPNRVSVVLRDSETQQPLANVQIKVGEKILATNAQGVVEARGVIKGTTFQVLPDGYQPLAVEYDGQGDFDLAVTPNRVNVVVVNQYTNQPVANAQVQFNERTITATVDGKVVLNRVKSGMNVRASLTGFDSASASFGGGDIQLALRPNTLDGVVSDAVTGLPISGTLVYSGTTIVATNSKGEYHLDNVPPKVALMFKAPAYSKTQVDVSKAMRQDVKLTPFLVKAIHIPFGIPADRVNEMIDLVGKTELNAIVIDVKAEKGRLAWDSQVPLAKQIGAAYLHGVDLNDVIQRCKAQKIYCIARMPVFQDNLLASARPAQAIRNLNGTVFTETAGQQWLNPYIADNSSYAIALAKEIAAMGFDEIQFDYVRFPGRISGVDFGFENTEDNRVAAIAAFLARAQKELRPTGIFISADVFGLTTATDDDQGTGQRLRDLGPNVDYISPMVYPDTWVEAADLLTKGLGISNCTEAVRCPYDVIYNSFKRATEKTSAKVRLWLQAYSGRGNFGIAEYRIQKKAATDAGSYGWMFWNGQGVYDPKMFDSK